MDAKAKRIKIREMLALDLVREWQSGARGSVADQIYYHGPNDTIPRAPHDVAILALLVSEFLSAADRVAFRNLLEES